MIFTVFQQKRLVTFYKDPDKNDKIGQLIFAGQRENSRLIAAKNPMLLQALCDLNNEQNPNKQLVCAPDATFRESFSDEICLAPSLLRSGNAALYFYRNGEQVGRIVYYNASDSIEFEDEAGIGTVKQAFYDFILSLSTGVSSVMSRHLSLRSIKRPQLNRGEDLSLNTPGCSLKKDKRLTGSSVQQGIEGEERTAQMIQKYDPSIHQLHSLKGKVTGQSDLDHLLLGDFGIILADSKNYRNSCVIENGKLKCGGRRIIPKMDGVSMIVHNKLLKEFPRLSIPIYKAIVLHIPRPQEIQAPDRDELLFTNFNDKLFKDELNQRDTTIHSDTLFTYAERFASDEVLGQMKPVLSDNEVNHIYNVVKYSSFWDVE